MDEYLQRIRRQRIVHLWNILVGLSDTKHNRSNVIPHPAGILNL